MKLELKKITHNARLSEETDNFAATLYVDGVKAAEVSNHGTGGPNNYHWYDRSLEPKVEAYVKTLPEYRFEDGSTIEMDLDLVVSELLQAHLLQKDYKKWVKKNTRTVYRTKDMKKGEYSIINVPYTPAEKERLQKQYGDKLDVIVNELVKQE